MNLLSRISKNALFVAALFATGNVAAGPGHDHGDVAPATNTGKASPRFEAHSELFEAVGTLGTSELSIIIDRYNNNEPLLNAKVDLESGSTKLAGVFHAEHGDYSFAAKPFEKPGNYPITLTVTAGEDVDILAGNLMIPPAETAHAHEDGATHWKSWAAIGALVVGFGVAITLFVRRRSGRVSYV
ncbi:MAG: hypothetical protein H7232_13000 [Aeromicrobium sp.]|nr:hypothetical protein [Burkholderiales bacterium]